MRECVSWCSAAFLLLMAVLLTSLITLVVIKYGKDDFAQKIGRISVHLAEEHRKASILGAITALAGIDQDIRAATQKETAPDNPAVMSKMRYIFNKFDLDNMIVLTDDGTVNAYLVKNVKTSITGKNFVWRPYFSGAIAGKSTMYAAFGSNSHERGFYISAPVPQFRDQESVGGLATNSSHASPLGVIVAKLGFEEIDQRIAAELFPLVVLSPEGAVFASNIPSWLYQVLGGPEALERVQEDKRVNNAYKDKPPALIPLDATGRIKQNGRTMQMFAADIAWPDPSGVWRVAGFVSDEDIFWLAGTRCHGNGYFPVVFTLSRLVACAAAGAA